MPIPKNNIEITRKTIGQLLNDIAAEYPNNMALIHSDFNIRYNYNLFLSEINRAARGLIKMGIKKVIDTT